MKRAAAIALLAFAGAAGAQSLQPGEWEFTSTTSSPMLPKPQSATVRQCVKDEDASNPERWMGRQNEKGDCKFTHSRRGPDTVAWEMSCPRQNMRGSGTARMGRDSMESEMQMSGDAQGRKFEMRTRMSGRRLGPCKS
jgi:hypothetical protein